MKIEALFFYALTWAHGKMEYIDKDTGEVVKVEVFVASFPYSDYGFALAVPSQRADDLAYAMVQLFKSVGGVPHIIVPDNLKSGVIKSDRYAPRLNDLLLDLANHYGSLVEPARVRHPQDKALVENSVKLTYQRAYAPLRNRQFYSLEELNQALSECMLAHNQKRMQQYDHTREGCFLANEKAALKPLPSTDYEVKRVHELKVSDSCFVYLSSYKTYYSVPCEWVGSTLKVVITRSLVKIYMKGECVATHLRDDSRRWIYDEKHFPKNTQNWRGRNRQWFVERGHTILWALGEYIDGVFIHCGTIEQAMIVMRMATGGYIRQGLPVIITGAEGTGKSFLATAFGQQACLMGLRVRYFGLQKLFEEITVNRIAGTLPRFFDKLSHTEMLIIDDFGLRCLDPQQMLDFMEIIEGRHGRCATIFVSQVPVTNWMELMAENTTAAEAILDRIVHTAIRFDLKGESRRRK